MQISVGVALQRFVCSVVDFHVIAVRPASISIAPLNWSKFYESTAGFLMITTFLLLNTAICSKLNISVWPIISCFSDKKQIYMIIR